MSVYIGTSGWAYKEWKPDVYPAGLAPADFLGHYATIFNTCEVNATAYRLPKADVVAGWAAAVPADFRFVIKAHRLLTEREHMAWDDADRRLLARLLEAIAPLGDRLGALMLPYSDTRERDDDALDAVLAGLPADLPVAFEFRHPSWHTDAVRQRVAAHGGTVALWETAGAVPAALAEGRFAYVRLRADHYDDPARDGWHDLLAHEGTDRDVYAIARHQDLAAGDPHAGVGLAAWLIGRADREG